MLKKSRMLAAFLLAAALAAATGCGTAAPSSESAGASQPASSPTSSESSSAPAGDGRDIVVLYTNDVHCGAEDGIGYAGVSAYKKELQETADVALVDCGDAVQGGTMGTLTKGEAIINIMNSVGYDLAIPGNHEFDYGMERFLELAGKADFPYISCNFTDLRTGEGVFSPYKILELGGKKIAFVGVTTPMTITDSTPAYFQDGAGNYIYGFCQDDTGAALYSAVQAAVDAARAEGADYCVLMAHLGIEAAASPYMSTEVIENTNGIDAVLDGHSHSTLESEQVRNKDGKYVLLTQTGTKLAALGKLTISADGKLSSELVTDYETKDAAVEQLIADEKAKYADVLSEVVAKTGAALVINDPVTGARIVRNNETNLGDLCADAYKAATGAQIGFANGGGVRVDVPAGDITYGQMLDVNPFGNSLCVIKATGRQIADALELSVSLSPEEFGGYLQVSGITFDVDLSVPSGVKLDENGMFVSVEGEARRVSNIKVDGRAMDPEAYYTVGGVSYILEYDGNGYSMFDGCEVLMDGSIVDVDSLVAYLKDGLGGTVGDDYADPYGAGRITYK